MFRGPMFRGPTARPREGEYGARDIWIRTTGMPAWNACLADRS